MVNEAALIDLIRVRFADRLAPGAIALRSDCAILSPPPRGGHLVTSCDQMWAGRHFATYEPAEVVGYRAVVRAASDVCAAGGTPRELLWAFCLDEASWRPAQGNAASFFARFLDGAHAACADNDMVLAGGDITRGERFGLTLTVMGHVAGRPLQRGACAPGDALYLSGPCGAAAHARTRCDAANAWRPAWREAFAPRLSRVGPVLVGRASAATDVSDGLAHDLGALVEGSGCGACLEGTVIDAMGAPREAVLYGGDDYVLLWSEAPDLAPLPGSIRIGVIEAGGALSLVDEKGRSALPRLGYDPFRA